MTHVFLLDETGKTWVLDTEVTAVQHVLDTQPATRNPQPAT